ncbi:MAG: hypothetical protein IIC99_10525 [Chloroflexi bacterium]|nr:hypothetical protein [Chloroflexota bacterium]
MPIISDMATIITSIAFLLVAVGALVVFVGIFVLVVRLGRSIEILAESGSVRGGDGGDGPRQ